MFDELNDPAFVRSLTSGDEDAFRRLFDALAPPLAVFVERMGLNAADAEEVAADALLKVYKARHSYDPNRGAKLTTWVFQIAHNSAVDRLRSQGTLAVAHAEFRAESKRISAIRQAPGTEARSSGLDALSMALARLSPGDQDLLRMRQIMSYREIATAEGATESAVRVRAKRALDRLKQIVQEQTYE